MHTPSGVATVPRPQGRGTVGSCQQLIIGHWPCSSCSVEPGSGVVALTAAGLRQAAADHVADAQWGHIQPGGTGTEALAVITVVTAAAISTPSTLRTKTISSVVLKADLVCLVLVVRRRAFASAA